MRHEDVLVGMRVRVAHIDVLPDGLEEQDLLGQAGEVVAIEDGEEYPIVVALDNVSGLVTFRPDQLELAEV